MYYSLKRATLWNILGYLYLLIAALISTPILVRYLGVSQFAQYGLAMATLYLVSSIDLGLPQAVVRALSRHHIYSVERQTLWATSSLLFILTGIVSGVVAIIISHTLGLDFRVYLPMFALALMTSLVSHYSLLPQAEGHFGYFNAKTFIVGTSNTFIAAYLSWIGAGVPAILLSLLCSYLFTLILLAYFSLKFFPHPRLGRPSLIIAKSLITFGLKNQVGKLVGSAQSQYGKYLLVTLSPLTLSAYVIGQSLVQKLVGGVSQVSTAFYPTAARSGATTGTRRLYLRLQLSLFGLGILALFLYQLFGETFLTWWLTDKVLVSQIHSFLSVYRFYGLLLLLTPLASTVLDGLGHPGATSFFGTLAFIIEVILAVLLLPSYGLLAPAYAGIISLGIMVPLLLIFTEKILSRGESTTR
jgi:O-antigen/teichoic acid export membrane protein